MATFTVNGYEIRSDQDNQVADTKVAELQFVAPLGEATLDVRYVTDGPTSAEVSLNNYNLLLNGLHLNDGVLPDRIEMFDATWPMQDGSTETSRVFNLAYSDADGWQDYLFSVDNAPLPDFTSTGAANQLVTQAEFNVLAGADVGNTFTIQLDDMPGVLVSGVIQRMFDQEVTEQQTQDHFDFNYNADSEPPDITEFDIAARAEELNPLSPEPGQANEGASVMDDDWANPDLYPGFDELGG